MLTNATDLLKRKGIAERSIKKFQDELSEIATEMAKLPAELTAFLAVASGSAGGTASESPKPDVPSVDKLKEILSGTTNKKRAKRAVITKAGYNLGSALKMAEDNPSIFGCERKPPAQGDLWLK